MPVCSSCGAQIVWARTKNGKAMPLDTPPAGDGRGTIRLTRGGHAEGGLQCEVLTEAERATHRGTLYTTHWATCPNAKSHRKAKA